ncbi:chemotaxis protein CheA [Caballeronia peredens]|nr:chemotaxis protein CheA [Caballeronia peredens]
MNKTTLQLACAVLFCAAQLAHADTTANSTSGSISGSTSTGIGQGGGSSLNNIGTSANSTATTNSNSSSVGGLGVATANGGRSSATGGSSNVNISLTMPALTNSNSNSSSASTMASSTGAAGTAGTAGTAGSTGAASTTGADATGKASTPGSSAFDTRTTVDYNQSSYSVRTTPAIAAPALTTTLSDTCMGSASFGLSVTGFGATGGTTMVDQACVRRLDAREFRAMGLTDVALALLCQSDANRRAVEATGHLCPGTTTPLAKSGEGAVLSDDEKYRDPLVRARLGLPVTAANNPDVKLKTQDAPEVRQPAPAPVAAKQIAQPAPAQAAAPVAARVSEQADDVEVASAPIGEKIEVSLVK